MTHNHICWNDSEKTGRGRKVLRLVGLGIGGITLAALFALALGFVVQWLWNWLMPDVFGIKEITYWQAFGLLILGRLLFGGFGHHGSSHHRGHFRKGSDHHHSDHWKKYGHFWHDRGKSAADEMIDRAGKVPSEPSDGVS